MNYQGKNKLFMTIGLIVLLIVTLLILISAKPQAQGTLLLFAGIILVLALVGVYVAYRQVSSIRKRITRLPESYQCVYLDAHELVGTYGVGKRDKQEIMTMILEIFEHASLDNRQIDEVISNDLNTFVEGFISETGVKNTVLFHFGYSSSMFIGYLLFMKAYKVIRTGHISINTLQSETLDVGLIVTYCIISYVFFPWLLLSIQRSAKYQWRGAKRIQVLLPFIVPISLLSGLILINDPQIVRIIQYPVHIFTNLWSVGIGILLLIGFLWLMKFQKNS